MSNDEFSSLKAINLYEKWGVISPFEAEEMRNKVRVKMGYSPLAHRHAPNSDEGYGAAECPSCKTPVIVKLLGEADATGAYRVDAICPACEFELVSYTPRTFPVNDPSFGNLFSGITSS